MRITEPADRAKMEHHSSNVCHQHAGTQDWEGDCEPDQTSAYLRQHSTWEHGLLLRRLGVTKHEAAEESTTVSHMFEKRLLADRERICLRVLSNTQRSPRQWLASRVCGVLGNRLQNKSRQTLSASCTSLRNHGPHLYREGNVRNLLDVQVLQFRGAAQFASCQACA